MPRYISLPLIDGRTALIDAKKVVMITKDPNASGTLVRLADLTQLFVKGTVDDIAGQIGTCRMVGRNPTGATHHPIHINHELVLWFEEIPGPAVTVHIVGGMTATIDGGTVDMLPEHLVKLDLFLRDNQ